MYDARAIANYFLDLATRDGKTLTPMQIVKLVYYAHGWNLAITDQPLITERVEAWRYGPVIPSVYHSFKMYGNRPIEDPARDLVIPPGEWYSRGWPEPFSIDNNKDDPTQNEFVKKLLERVWQSYGQFTGVQLSNMTHEPESPWATTRRRTHDAKWAVISDDVIRDYFILQTDQHGATRA